MLLLAMFVLMLPMPGQVDLAADDLTIFASGAPVVVALLYLRLTKEDR